MKVHGAFQKKIESRVNGYYFPVLNPLFSFGLGYGLWGRRLKEQSPLCRIDYIREAAGIQNTRQRIEALTDLVQIMSHNLENPNWKEVIQLWKLLNHLPLNTFDLWTAFTRDEEALVSLFFFQENELIDRLSKEYPILWETIPVNTWINAATDRYEQLRNQLPDYAYTLMETKTLYVDNQLGLKCLAAILRDEVLELENDDLKMAAKPGLVKYQLNRLLNGEAGFRGLKNRKAEEHWQWPEHLNREIRSVMEKLPQEVKAFFPAELTNHRVSVIFLPVALAASTVDQELYPWHKSKFEQIFQLREIQSFDEEWFRTVYDLFQGYFWENNKLTKR